MIKIIDGYNLVEKPYMHLEALKTTYWFLTGDKRAYLYQNVGKILIKQTTDS